VLNPLNPAGWLRSYSWCHPIGMSIGIQRCAHLCGAKVLINKVIAKYFAVFFNKNRETGLATRVH
jgi:hypothetical protein